MNNPYLLLGIKETATSEEIKKACRNRIKLYCNGSGDVFQNRKSSDGRYLQEMFLNAQEDLLDVNKRRKIDEALALQRKEHAIMPSLKKDRKAKSNSENIQQEFVSKEKRNVTDIHICLYDNNQIGLFKKQIYKNSYGYSGIIYHGIDSDNVGIYSSGLYSNGSLPCGESLGKFVATCVIKEDFSFDSVRFDLFNKGLIDAYTIGEATSYEILDVMKKAVNNNIIGTGDSSKNGSYKKQKKSLLKF